MLIGVVGYEPMVSINLYTHGRFSHYPQCSMQLLQLSIILLLGPGIQPEKQQSGLGWNKEGSNQRNSKVDWWAGIRKDKVMKWSPSSQQSCCWRRGRRKHFTPFSSFPQPCPPLIHATTPLQGSHDSFLRF